MDQADLLNIIGSAYDKLVADVAARIESRLLMTRIEEIVQAKLDDLGPIDKDMVREVCEEVIDASDIDDKINDYMSVHFEISDYESEIKDMVDVDDAIETHLNTYLHDEVVSCIQGLTFNVEVSSR